MAFTTQQRRSRRGGEVVRPRPSAATDARSKRSASLFMRSQQKCSQGSALSQMGVSGVQMHGTSKPKLTGVPFLPWLKPGWKCFYEAGFSTDSGDLVIASAFSLYPTSKTGPGSSLPSSSLGCEMNCLLITQSKTLAWAWDDRIK